MSVLVSTKDSLGMCVFFDRGDTDWFWFRRRRGNVDFCPFEEMVEGVSILLVLESAA